MNDWYDADMVNTKYLDVLFDVLTIKNIYSLNFSYPIFAAAFFCKQGFAYPFLP